MVDPVGKEAGKPVAKADPGRGRIRAYDTSQDDTPDAEDALAGFGCRRDARTRTGL